MTVTDPRIESDNRLGLRWSNEVTFDLSKPCKIEIKEDDEPGFVVWINDTEFRTGYRGEEELPIDLTPLVDEMEVGYFFFGGETTGS